MADRRGDLELEAALDLPGIAAQAKGDLLDLHVRLYPRAKSELADGLPENLALVADLLTIAELEQDLHAGDAQVRIAHDQGQWKHRLVLARKVEKRHQLSAHRVRQLLRLDCFLQ